MSRQTLAFRGGDPSRRLFIDLAGTTLPAPCEYLSVSLLHLTMPYTFPQVSPLNTGFLLIKINDYSPNTLLVNGYRHRYTWCLPFDQAGVQDGHFSWYANTREDDRIKFQTPHFMSNLVLDLSFITPSGEDIAFPPTQAGKLCSVEILIKPENV